MSPEEKLEMGKNLIAEAEAEIAAKKRSWPENIEPGMCFGLRGFVYIYADFGDLVIVRSSEGAQNEGKRYAPAKGFAGLEGDFTYLGHARDLIKIADDAHEPTGAELVGKMCRLSLHPLDRPDSGVEDVVVNYDATTGEYYGERGQGRPWKYARLAR